MRIKDKHYKEGTNFTFNIVSKYYYTKNFLLKNIKFYKNKKLIKLLI